MTVLFDSIDLLHPCHKEICLVKGRADGTAVVTRHQLCEVALCRVIGYLGNGLETSHLRSLEQAQHQSGENLVWPTGRNESVILECLLVYAKQDTV